MKFIENPKVAKSIILSNDFQTYSMANRYRELERRTGVDFSWAIKFLEHLPVFMDGEFHQKVRKAMAKRISQSKIDHSAASVKALDELFGKLFFDKSKFDLVSDFAGPLWRAISKAIVEPSEDSDSLVNDTPKLFNPLLSIRERVKINDRIGRYLQAHAKDQESSLVLLCLASLGTRPFVGSLVLSLYQVLEASPAKRLSEVDWPGEFPSSSLRYVDRIAVSSGDDTGLQMLGDRVRCYTQSESYTREENNESLFGFGKHTCLGKSLSQTIWKLVVERFSSCDLIATCGGMEISPHNDPFFMPASAKISLSKYR